MRYPINITKLNSEKKTRELGVIELCAGIGQTSIALQKACNKLGINMKIHAFCEIDKYASMSYRALHSSNIPNLEDMTKADFSNYECDILLATTPCTNISMIGNKLGFGKDSNTASSIVWHTFRIIDQMKRKPKIIFFENVKAMVSKKNEKDFNALKNALESRGYKVSYKVLDAADFSVPQHRERVYIIATLGNVFSDFPAKVVLTTYLKDILEENPSSKYIEKDMDRKITSTNERGYSYRVHNSTSKVAFTLTTKSRGQANNNYIFVDDACDDEVVRFTPKNGHLLEDYKKLPIRTLTRLEQGRLMGMTDEDIHKLDFVSDTQFSKQMGNGVVIPVVEKIFTNLLEAMFSSQDTFIEEKKENTNMNNYELTIDEIKELIELRLKTRDRRDGYCKYSFINDKLKFFRKNSSIGTRIICEEDTCSDDKIFYYISNMGKKIEYMRITYDENDYSNYCFGNFFYNKSVVLQLKELAIETRYICDALYAYLEYPHFADVKFENEKEFVQSFFEYHYKFRENFDGIEPDILISRDNVIGNDCILDINGLVYSTRTKRVTLNNEFSYGFVWGVKCLIDYARQVSLLNKHSKSCSDNLLVKQAV